jgi:hypothetical protein
MFEADGDRRSSPTLSSFGFRHCSIQVVCGSCFEVSDYGRIVTRVRIVVEKSPLHVRREKALVDCG